MLGSLAKQHAKSLGYQSPHGWHLGAASACSMACQVTKGTTQKGRFCQDETEIWRTAASQSTNWLILCSLSSSRSVNRIHSISLSVVYLTIQYGSFAVWKSNIFTGISHFHWAPIHRHEYDLHNLSHPHAGCGMVFHQAHLLSAAKNRGGTGQQLEYNNLVQWSPSVLWLASQL